MDDYYVEEDSGDGVHLGAGLSLSLSLSHTHTVCVSYFDPFRFDGVFQGKVYLNVIQFTTSSSAVTAAEENGREEGMERVL